MIRKFRWEMFLQLHRKERFMHPFFRDRYCSGNPQISRADLPDFVFRAEKARGAVGDGFILLPECSACFCFPCPPEMRRRSGSHLTPDGSGTARQISPSVSLSTTGTISPGAPHTVSVRISA